MRPTEYGIARSSAAHPASKTERGNHQARIAEHQLRLDESLPFLLAEQTIGIDIDAFQRNRRRIAGPNSVLIFRLAVAQSGGILFNDKPAGSAGSFGENGIKVGKSAVADPLLVAGDFVSRDFAVLDYGIRYRAQGAEVAAGFRLRGAIGHKKSFLADARHPPLPLLVGAADRQSDRCQEMWQKSR